MGNNVFENCNFPTMTISANSSDITSFIDPDATLSPNISITFGTNQVIEFASPENSALGVYSIIYNNGAQIIQTSTDITIINNGSIIIDSDLNLSTGNLTIISYSGSITIEADDGVNTITPGNITLSAALGITNNGTIDVSAQNGTIALFSPGDITEGTLEYGTGNLLINNALTNSNIPTPDLDRTLTIVQIVADFLVYRIDNGDDITLEEGDDVTVTEDMTSLGFISYTPSGLSIVFEGHVEISQDLDFNILFSGTFTVSIIAGGNIVAQRINTSIQSVDTAGGDGGNITLTAGGSITTQSLATAGYTYNVTGGTAGHGGTALLTAGESINLSFTDDMMSNNLTSGGGFGGGAASGANGIGGNGGSLYIASGSDVTVTFSGSLSSGGTTAGATGGGGFGGGAGQGGGGNGGTVSLISNGTISLTFEGDLSSGGSSAGGASGGGGFGGGGGEASNAYGGHAGSIFLVSTQNSTLTFAGNTSSGGSGTNGSSGGGGLGGGQSLDANAGNGGYILSISSQNASIAFEGDASSSGTSASSNGGGGLSGGGSTGSTGSGGNAGAVLISSYLDGSIVFEGNTSSLSSPGGGGMGGGVSQSGNGGNGGMIAIVAGQSAITTFLGNTSNGSNGNAGGGLGGGCSLASVNPLGGSGGTVTMLSGASTALTLSTLNSGGTGPGLGENCGEINLALFSCNSDEMLLQNILFPSVPGNDNIESLYQSYTPITAPFVSCTNNDTTASLPLCIMMTYQTIAVCSMSDSFDVYDPTIPSTTSVWTWEGPGNITEFSSRFTADNPGHYTGQITINDCTLSIATANILGITLTASPSPSVCQHTPLTLTADVVGGAEPFEYQWFSDSTQIYETDISLTDSSGDSNNQIVFPTTTPGVYDISVTVNTNGCSQEADLTITVYSLPTVTIDDITVCGGTTFSLEAVATGGSGIYETYSWTVPDEFIPDADFTVDSTANSNIQNFTSPNTNGIFSFSVHLIDTNGCSTTGTGNVTVLESPSITLETAQICPSTEFTLEAIANGGSGDYISYSWTIPDGFEIISPFEYTLDSSFDFTIDSTTETNIPTFKASGIPGSYIFYVHVTDSNGCIGYTSSNITVFEPANITVTALIDNTAGDITFNDSTQNILSVCNGQLVSLVATPVVDTTNDYAYIWYDNNGSIISTDNPFLVPTHTNGNFYYSVIATDSNGCVSPETLPFYINVSTLSVNIMADNTMVCQNTPITLTADPLGGSGEYIGYQWYKNNILIPEEDSLTLSINTENAGTDLYTVVVEDSYGCVSQASPPVTITVYPLPEITLSAASICQGDIFEMTVESDSSTTIFSSYIWEFPSVFQFVTDTTATPYDITSGDTSIETTLEFDTTSGTSVAFFAAPYIEGTYTFSVTATDIHGCSKTTSSSVTVLSKPMASIDPVDPICLSTPITLTATSGFENYIWYLENTIVQHSSSNTYAPPNDTAGNFIYSVIVEDSNSCTSNRSAPITLIIYDLPSISLENAHVCPNALFSMTATAMGGSGEFTAFSWTIPEGFHLIDSTDHSSATDITIDTTSDVETPVFLAPEAPGNYMFYVHVTDTNGCNSIVTSAQVTVFERPSVNISGPFSSCENHSIALQANIVSDLTNTTTPNYTYIWYKDTVKIPDANQDTLIVNIPSSGIFSYTVTATDTTSGCISLLSSPHNIVIYPQPEVIIEPSTLTICPGRIFALEALTSDASQGISSYVWDYPNVFELILEQDETTDSTIDITTEPIDNTNLDTSVDITSGFDSTSFTNVAVFLAPYIEGTYTFTATVISEAGCISQSTAIVTVRPVPHVTITSSPDISGEKIIQNTPVTLTAVPSGGITPYLSYQWYNYSTPIAGAINATYNVVTSSITSFLYTVVVTDASTCTSPQSAPFPLTIVPPPTKSTTNVAGIVIPVVLLTCYFAFLFVMFWFF